MAKSVRPYPLPDPLGDRGAPAALPGESPAHRLQAQLEAAWGARSAPEPRRWSPRRTTACVTLASGALWAALWWAGSRLV